RRAERVEGAQHLVLLDQLAHQLDRLGRNVAVVVADEVDLATVDAALLVDALPVGLDGLADHPVGRGWTAIGVGVADLDLGVARSVVVLLLRERYALAAKQRCGRCPGHEGTPAGPLHMILPGYEVTPM